MSSTKRPTLAVSVGCPSGIGAEVAVAGAARAKDVRCVLVGDLAVVRRAARLRRIPERRLVAVDGKAAARALLPGQIGVWVASTEVVGPVVPGKPTPEGGAAQLAWIDEATALVQAGVADALVTGPVSKHAIATSGGEDAKHFRGHTEHLAARLGAREVVMAFRSPELTSALVTTHLSLSRVPGAVTPRAVASSVYWIVRLLRALGIRRPRVAIAALNPHAGEEGLLGDEERKRITPGIALAERRLRRERTGAVLTGPIGAETAFRRALAGAFDGVVAMYHDQATIPHKVLGFGEAVNVTLGLPIVRTSVDHGTAYDLAGTGRADPSGMQEAMSLAAALVPKRPRR